jgi:hypothetical protein
VQNSTNGANTVKVVTLQRHNEAVKLFYHQECFAFLQERHSTRPGEDRDLEDCKEDDFCSWCYALLAEPAADAFKPAPRPLVSFEETKQGLVISITSEDTRREIREISSNTDMDRDAVFCEVVAEVLCNSSWQLVPEYYYLEIGALTTSLILSPDLDLSDQGELISCNTTYWYPEYEVFDPIEELLKHGKVVFTKGEA